jgi:hypothetical protein
VATDLETITVRPDSDIARLLEQAAETPAIIEARGVRYRVMREDDDPFAHYDPQRAKAALDRAFGSLTGVDTDALLAELREHRAQDSVGRPD